MYEEQSGVAGRSPELRVLVPAVCPGMKTPYYCKPENTALKCNPHDSRGR